MTPYERCRKTFLDYHQNTHRQITNRDKALVRDYRGNFRKRFYLTPTVSTLVDRHFVPDEKTSWQFTLYRTTILTVEPNDVGTIDLSGWYSQISFAHLTSLLNSLRGSWHYRISSFRANQWTRTVWKLNNVLLFDGLKLNLVTGEFLNPRPLKRLVVADVPEVREIRKNLTAVKKRYMGFAKLHEVSKPDLPQPRPITYQQLIEETESTAETYSSLVLGYYPTWRTWNKIGPAKILDARLTQIRNEQYRKFLVEEEI